MSINYTVQEFIDILKQNIVKIVITRKDSTIKELKITLMEGVIVGDCPVSGYFENVDGDKYKMCIWSVDKNDWVNFPFARIESIEIL